MNDSTFPSTPAVPRDLLVIILQLPRIFHDPAHSKHAKVFLELMGGHIHRLTGMSNDINIQLVDGKRKLIKATPSPVLVFNDKVGYPIECFWKDYIKHSISSDQLNVDNTFTALFIEPDATLHVAERAWFSNSLAPVAIRPTPSGINPFPDRHKVFVELEGKFFEPGDLMEAANRHIEWLNLGNWYYSTESSFFDGLPLTLVRSKSIQKLMADRNEQVQLSAEQAVVEQAVNVENEYVKEWPAKLFTRRYIKRR